MSLFAEGLIAKIKEADGYDDFIEGLKQEISDDSYVPVPAMVLRLFDEQAAKELAEEMENENDTLRSYKALRGLDIES